MDRLVLYPRNLVPIVGENGAGKSNILRALDLALGPIYPKTKSLSPLDFFRSEHGENRASIRVWLRNLDGEDLAYFGRKGVLLPESQTIGVRVDRNWGREEEDEFGFVDEDGEFLRYQSSRGPGNIIRPTNEERERFSFLYVDADRNIRQHLATNQWSLLGRLLRRVERELPPERRKEFVRRIAELERETLKTGDLIALEERLGALVLEQMNPRPRSLELKVSAYDPWSLYRTIQVFIDDGFYSTATEKGRGLQSVVILSLFRLYYEVMQGGAEGRPSIILGVEEPEIFLHPHAERYLYEIFRGIAEAGGQVLYTTHSPFLIQIEDYENVVMVRKDADGRTQSETISDEDLEERIAGGRASEALRLTPRDRLRLEREFDAGKNEVFFGRKVILVEGPSEQLALRVVAARPVEGEPVDLDREGVSIIESGGKKSLPLFVKILERMQKPYLVVFDEDSSDFSAGEKEREEEFNRELSELAGPENCVMMVPNLEDELSRALGGERYMALLEQLGREFGGVPKASQAKLVIQRIDPLEIPEKFHGVIRMIVAL